MCYILILILFRELKRLLALAILGGVGFWGIVFLLSPLEQIVQIALGLAVFVALFYRPSWAEGWPTALYLPKKYGQKAVALYLSERKRRKRQAQRHTAKGGR